MSVPGGDLTDIITTDASAFKGLPTAVVPQAEPELDTIVIVTWRDAYFQFTEGDPRADYAVRTIGFVVNTDETWLTLAAEELPDDDGFRAITYIPRACVLKVDRLA